MLGLVVRWIDIPRVRRSRIGHFRINLLRISRTRICISMKASFVDWTFQDLLFYDR